MEESDLEYCEINLDSQEETDSKSTQNVNFEETKKKLFKIACNNEKDQGNNVEDLEELLKNLRSAEKIKLCQAKDENDNTALHYAAKAGNVEICKTLTKDGADTNATGQNGMRVLPFAARYGDEKKVEEVWECMKLIAKESKKSAPVNNIKRKKPSVRKSKLKMMGKTIDEETQSQFAAQERDKYNFNILHHAIQNTNWAKNTFVVEKLISTRSFPITETDNQGNTCLHLAAQFDKQRDDKVFDAFFSNNSIPWEDIAACIKRRNERGMTPIHIACAVGNLDSLEALLEVCQKNSLPVEKIINHLDKNGLLPLCYAITNKNHHMVEMLLEKGAHVVQGTMITAARIGDVDIMRTLKIRENTLKTTTHGDALLSAAAEHNNTAMAKYLMSQTSRERSCTGTRGATPFMLAIQEGNIEVLNVIHDKDSVNQKDAESKNVLHYAFASKNPEEVTKYLEDLMKKAPSADFRTKLKELLTAKDCNNDTPLHTLARRNLEPECFKRLFKHLNIGIECLKENNSSQETPLHLAAAQDRRNFVEAVLSLCEDNPEIGKLLAAKGKDSNTPLHLASNQKRPGCPPLLLFLKRTKEPVKYLSLENNFGGTPFSGAVAAGDPGTVGEMLKDLLPAEKKALVSHVDGINASSLHIAAERGYVDIFNLLLNNEAEITQKGPDQKTALEIAIEKDQREVIRSIIKSPKWKEAFRMPCTSINGELNTPLRMLIRHIPDLADEFLDRCCEKEATLENETEDERRRKQDVININCDFIEDTTSYMYPKNEDDPEKKQLIHKDDLPEVFTGYAIHNVDIDNHPLIIMANEKKVDLLQHPVCSVITNRKWDTFGFKSYLLLIGVYVIFLTALNLFILTSPSPINTPENFTCTEFFSRKYTEYRKSITNDTARTYDGTRKNSTVSSREAWKEHWNPIFRIILLVLNFARVVFFFAYGEISPIWRQTKKSFEEIKKLRKPKLPLVFFFDFLIYSLALFVACHDFFWDPSCFQWQVGAVTITLAWINLLLQMRLLYGIGIYIIIFKDVILTFLKISIVFVILLVGFAFCFHILLSHRQEFKFPYDAMLKTIIMMSGEIEYGEIFFKDRPPIGFGDEWDQDWEKVPFPVVTYTMFLAFVICVTFVAFNVLVGLTVDDIRNFLANADLRKLSMRLEFIRQMEQVQQIPWIIAKEKKPLDTTISKDTSFGSEIWKEIEKRQVERRKKGKVERELSEMQEKMKELKVMLVDTNKLIRSSLQKPEEKEQKG